MKLKLKPQQTLFFDLTTQKLIELRQYLGLKKLQFFYLNFKYLKGFRNNYSIFELAISKLHFKKIIKLIYSFHSKKKKILFIGFDMSIKPLNFKELFYSYNHLYFSEIWFNSLITSNFSQKKIFLYFKNFLVDKFVQKNSKKRSKMIKEFSFFLESPDLIVYLFEKNTKQLLLKEIAKIKSPAVILAQDSNNLSNILYKIFGNFNKYKKKQFFYFILKAIFSLTKTKKINNYANQLL